MYCSISFSLLLATVLNLLIASNASNILGLFPHAGYSHFKIFAPILRGLAERGHNVTVITFTKNPAPHSNLEELLLKGKDTAHVFRFEDHAASRSLNILLGEYFALHHEGQTSCEIFYQSPHVEHVLERHKHTPFDLVITEYFNTDCQLGVSYLMQVPVVALCSCALMPWIYDRILLPDTPSHIQSQSIGFPEELNWQQRLVNFVQAKTLKLLYRYHTNYYDNKLIKKYLNLDVDVNEIAKTSTSLIFVNQQYTLSGNRPLTPQLIEIGGIHITQSAIDEPLPSEISDFLQQDSVKDVLFISWGSMLRAASIDKQKLNAILKVLQKLPLKIIWKWESSKKPIQSKQFLFVKWAPQLSLLCHPKVKLFWGHGGLLGTTEAVHCGKPMILTPIYGDQFVNANAVANRKVGLILHYHDIDEQHLTQAMQEIMRMRYAENALTLSKLFRDHETTPLETSLWWIEHLLRHGSPASEVLHTKAVHLNWFVYHSLDSVLLLLAGAAVLLLFLRRIIQIIALSLRKRRSKIKSN